MSSRYCIARDTGNTYRVYDTQLKSFAEPMTAASDKKSATLRATERNTVPQPLSPAQARELHNAGE